MSAAKTCDVAVFGDLFVDLVMSGFERLPCFGEEELASCCTRETGGGTAHTACGLAILGARTKVFGVIGAADADWFRLRLGSKDVNTESLTVHPTEPTAITVAVSTSQDRMFYTYAGANCLLPQLLVDASIRHQLSQARHVHFAHLMEPSRLLELTRWLHHRGCTVSIDVGWSEPWLRDPATLEALADVDCFFPNQAEAGCITGESEPARILEWFRAHGVRQVALKLGAKGSAVLKEGELVHVAGVALQPVDTTGAGDCFDAGFLFAWLHGMTLKECLSWGNVCGALSTRTHGGIEGFPIRAEVERALRHD